MVKLFNEFGDSLLKAMPFLNKVDAPVYQIGTGQVMKGIGNEKMDAGISDEAGASVYIRITGPERYNFLKQVSSCSKEYQVSVPCRAVFYSFQSMEVLSAEEVKPKITEAIRKTTLPKFKGPQHTISTQITSAGWDLEKIYLEETKKPFTGSEWAVLVAIDFILNYREDNCEPCLTNEMFCQ